MYATLTNQSIELINAQLVQIDLLPATRRRLEALRFANQINSERVREILSAAGLTHTTDTWPPGIAAADNGEAAFTLIEYYDHILRDWAPDRHESTENELLRESVIEVLGAAEHLGRTLVLGAGACRVTYDLHQVCEPELTIALDINPLLLLSAKRIIFEG